MRQLSIACFIACVGCAAAAQTGIVDLVKVRVEISAMKEAELRSLLSYVAECANRSEAAVSEQACRSARVRYLTEYGTNRAVDIAIDEAEKLLQIRRMIAGGVPPLTYEIDRTISEAVRDALRSMRPK